MYRGKLIKNKKGYILIYVMLLGFLMLSISLIVMKIELQKKDILLQQKKIKQNLNINAFNREYLFSELCNLLKTNNVLLEKESINNYLKMSSNVLDIKKDNMTISYDKDREFVTINYPYDNYNNCVELYDVDGNRINLTFKLINRSINERT